MSVQAGLIDADDGAWGGEQHQSASTRELVVRWHEQEYAALLRYAIFLGLPQEAAEDVIQESFLKLHRHLLRNGDRSNLRAWLYRVAYNGARSWQGGKASLSLQALADSPLPVEPVADTATPEQTLLTKERSEQIQTAVGQLSRAQRECLLLRAQGLKYREIAQALRLSTSTVAENVARGLEHLRNSV